MIGAVLLLITLIFLVVDVATNKPVRVRLALCAAHREKRRRQTWVAFGVIVLGLVVAAGSMIELVTHPASTSPKGWVGIPLFLVGILAFVSGMIWLALVRQVLGCSVVKDRRVWLKWAGPQFLGSLEDQ